MTPKDKLSFGLSGASDQTNLKLEKVQRLMKLVLADAASRRENAAYGGSGGDDGARELETQVKFFNYGWDAATQPWSASVPEEWKKFEIQLDPEYEQYQKLKKKFGNR